MSRPRCLLSGEPGVAVRKQTGAELLVQYERHFGIRLPAGIAAMYFQQAFTEYEAERSGLRWFDPPVAGGAEFYDFLCHSLPWYYSPDTWDKRHALAALGRLGSRSVFEAGCGGGEFLKAARSRGLRVSGSELNESQVAALRKDGLDVISTHDRSRTGGADALVLIQVLEHVPRPFEFLRDLLLRVRPKHLLIAVPAFDTLLGATSDPLVWPPHHITIWSRRALETLAHLLRARLTEVTYEPLDWPRFHRMVSLGLQPPIVGLPPAERPRLLRFAFLGARLLKRPWALRAHTIFGVFEFP